MNNSYQGIDPIIVKYVTFHASSLKSKSCFINESLEDIEQELFYQVWQYLDQYDEKRSSFNTFIARLTNHRARNMLRDQLRLKRNIIFDDISDDIQDSSNLETEAIIRTDINSIISTLSKRDRNLCELLKTLTVSEVSAMTKVSKASIYRVLDKIVRKFPSLK
ncbi:MULTISPECIES: sigma-70 family RNA polymerase sigma factor [unclassified Wolbachia]|uniref:sigma-70 family RNA polymerase sigma factor n=1 Tax=unclassified Wolbachia TaxID=2640676 RepID=UPI00223028A0|nr:sigma-70 family RNA polymerase sigma factor [Wolbachia endosymbiont (group B) of Ischnura elegans]